MEAKGCRVLLVYPRFTNSSFWNFKATCESVGAHYPAAPLGLITVAALLPQCWDVRLLDRNAEELTTADIDRADLVLTGGMLPQQTDALAVIALCRARGKPVVVGGPDATSSPHIYECANYRVLGEAESVMGQVVAAWEGGATSAVFEAEKYATDITQAPVPRFDLLNYSDYLHVGVQYSRGCPFNCEFCDVIELYGRVPRAKTTPQMLGELDALLALGYRGHVDFVDDNLVGNKRALKKFLPELIAWQKAEGYPFEFSAEASINLSDDDELLRLLRDANFFVVFVGLETPDVATLISAQKSQNANRNLAASVLKIHQAGIFVHAGFIVGFDSEAGPVASAMVECIEASAIPVGMVGLLYALPNTQLTRRLSREGRLHPGHDRVGKSESGDQCTSGLNYDTVRPRQEILSDYTRILEAIYDPGAYFSRVRRVGRVLGTGRRDSRQPVARPARSFGGVSPTDWVRFVRLAWSMTVVNPRLAGHFWGTLIDCSVRNPDALKAVVMLMALYLHLGPFSRDVVARITKKRLVLAEEGPRAAG